MHTDMESSRITAYLEGRISSANAEETRALHTYPAQGFGC